MYNLEKIEDFNYEGQRLLFEKSKRLEYDRFTILLIDEFDDDYLNLAINIKSQDKKEFDQDFIKIKEIMNKNGRKASVLIDNDVLLNTVDFKSKGLKISDNSIWLMKNIENDNVYTSDIPIEISRISKEEEKEYHSIVEKGFIRNSKEDPYDGLSLSVMEAIRRSFYIKSKFITEHYMAKYNNESVGTITIMYEKGIAYIYNVTTNIKYRNMGICKKLMSYVFKRLNKLGINNVILQTEKGFYPEKIYKKIGFKEIFNGVKYTEE